MLSFKSNESEEAKKMLDIKNIWADIWFGIKSNISSFFMHKSGSRIFRREDLFLCLHTEEGSGLGGGLTGAIGNRRSGGGRSGLHPGGRVEREENRVLWCHDSAKKLF